MSSPARTLRKRKADLSPSHEATNERKSTRIKTGQQSSKSFLSPAQTIDDDSDDDPSTLGPDRDPEFGTSTAVKIFYEGKPNRNGIMNWVETPPKQMKVKVAKANNRFAINIFKVKDHSLPTINGTTPLKIQSVQVQSAVLVNALKDIVKDEGMHLETTETAKFDEPFKALFFSYDKIKAMTQGKHQDKLLSAHSALLLQVMEELFGSIMTSQTHLKSSGLMSYKLAWTYFPKGSMLFCGTSDCERVCRVSSTLYMITSCAQFLQINCEELSFDGELFTWKPATLKIPAFAGNFPIQNLPCYPLSFHENPNGVSERLVGRAKKVLDYQELTYCEYAGVGLRETSNGIERHNVHGRILIDYFGHVKHQEGLQRNDNRAKRRRQGQQNSESTENSESNYTTSLAKDKQEENKKTMLGDRKDDLIFISPLLKGFSLKNKLWLQFYVDDISPVVWNDEAYGHLVYPQEQKDLVLTFVDNHQRLKTGADDVIIGKGQGLILLLSGPPGTGKTLTAEAVADKSRRPLYYLQAEDLGINAAQLGPKIKKVFEMATEWDAVILLDEADVFMAERDPGDIARNELVSIFLRELEYFRGIIFLTTNLYSTIDTAFRSRVNIHLVFQSLSVSSRLLLWQKFLSRLPSTDAQAKVNKRDLNELAKWELNGREIKNAIKTVRTWCICKGFEMNLLRLESGIKVTAPQAKKVVAENE